MKHRKAMLPIFELRGEFMPSTFDKKKRTVDLVWTTGERVLRQSFWDGPYYEELEVSDGAIRMDRLNNGAPVLDTHNRWSLKDQFGVVERAWLKDGKGYATVRFSNRDDVQGLVQDIEDGIIRNISVGYQIHKMEKINGPEGERTDETPIYRAIDWEPKELSFVPVPADAGSQVRSDNKNENQRFECELIINEREAMKNKTATVKRSETATPETKPEETPAPVSAEATPEATPAAAAAPSEGQPAAAAAAPTSEGEAQPSAESEERIQTKEIERQDAIRTAVRAAKLPETFADKLVKDKATVDAARAAVIAELEKSTSTQTNNLNIERGSGMDQKLARREAATRVLLNVFDKNNKIENGDGELRAHSLLSMARQVLSLEGCREAFQLSPTEVANRALHHTSDFPEILANVANKALRMGYEQAGFTHQLFMGAPRSVSDFKEVSSINVSTGSTLQKLNEHGEIKRGSLKESKEKYKLETYALIVGMTRQLLINDDLGAFTKVPMNLGMRAKQKEAEVFWSLFLSNKVMAETGQTLFHASHGNLAAAGSALSIDSLGVARAAMKSQLDMDKQPINVAPKFLLVPTGLETLADQFVSQITPNQAGQVNPFASKNKLEVIAEPRLDAAVVGGVKPWWVTADPSAIPMAEMLLLDGQGPKISVQQGWNIEGAETKIVYDFGMTILDYRGFYKNPGV